MSLGMSEILLILVVVLLLFGAKRLPEIARSLGRASSEFKRAKEDFLNEMEASAASAEKAQTAAPEKEIAADPESPAETASAEPAATAESADAAANDKEA